jgi:ribosomal protein L22
MDTNTTATTTAENSKPGVNENFISKEKLTTEDIALLLKHSCPSLNEQFSFKHAVNICIFMNKIKNVNKIKKELNDILEHKKALPFIVFNTGVRHKTKQGPGRYPEKRIKIILKGLKCFFATLAQKKNTDFSQAEIHTRATEGIKIKKLNYKAFGRANIKKNTKVNIYFKLTKI